MVIYGRPHPTVYPLHCRVKNRTTALTKDMEKAECISLERLHKNESQDTERQSDIFTACLNGHTRKVRLLVERGYDLNARDADGITPFMCAGLGGCVECVEMLINEFHCDINTMDTKVGRVFRRA